MRRLTFRPRLALAAACLSLGLLVPATAATTWSEPTGRQIEEFLTVFAPDAAPVGQAADLAAPIARLVAIEQAYNGGDKLTTLDMVLSNPDYAVFPHLQAAQDGLRAASSLGLFWSDEAARTAFLRFYNEVYLKDAALAADPQAFADRYNQGASLPDGQDPARYLYENLARYGYAPTMSLDPASHLSNLYHSFDRVLVDAARLGLGIEGLQVALPAYRESVLQRLVAQIAAARRYAEERSASVESWGEIIDQTDEAATESDPVTPLYPPAVVEEMETPAPSDAELTDIVTSEDPAPVEEPAVEESVADAAEEAMAEPIVESTPVAEPVAEDPSTDWSRVNIFSLPGDSPAPVIETSDPVVFEDAGSTSAEEESPTESTTLLDTGETPSEEIIAPAVEETAVEPAVEEPIEIIEPLDTAPVDPVAPSGATDPAAARAAGEAALSATLAAATRLGQQITNLVLLWNAPEVEGEAAAHAKLVEDAEEALRSQKEQFLAHLYLLDLYGVASRLEMDTYEIDDRILAALDNEFELRKSNKDQAVMANTAEIEEALAQIAEGVTGRAGSDAVQIAQQKAYDKQKTALADIANQLEATLG